MSEKEIEIRTQERIDLIRAVKRRKYLMRLGIDGERLGLEDGFKIAQQIERERRKFIEEMGRIRRISPRKGVKMPTTLAKEAEKRSKAAMRKLERDFNPRFNPKGVEGLTPDADGKIGLREARKLRPDIFAMPSMTWEQIVEARGIRNVNRSKGRSVIPAEAEEGSTELSGVHGVLPPGI